jgi:hypothetical protein
MSRLIHDLCDWMRIPHAERQSGKRNAHQGPPGTPLAPVTKKADAERRVEVDRASEEGRRPG